MIDGKQNMESNEWYFVEDYSSRFDYRGKNILSLTPEACYELDNENLDYSIIEEYVDDSKLFKEEDAYFNKQLEWFCDFDAFLKDSFSFCGRNGTNLGTAHFYRIKCLIDSLIICAYNFAKFSEKENPSIIYYLKREEVPGSTSFYSPFDSQKKIIPFLLESFCRENGINFKIIKEERKTKKNGDNYGAVLKFQLKNIFKNLHCKSVYNFFRYNKLSGLLSGQNGGQLNVLLLHAGCISIDRVVKDIIRSGGNAYLKKEKVVEKISTIFQKKILDLNVVDESVKKKIKKEAEETYEKFLNKRNLLEWISDKCGCEVAEIIAPYFHDFFLNICAENLLEFHMIEKFYQDKNIDFVAARSSSEKESISSLLVAEKGEKRVCFQHSCAAFRGRREHISELVLIDHYFAMHEEAEKRALLSRENKYIGKCNIFQEPSHIEHVKAKWVHVDRRQNTIMYIPSKVFFGFRTYNGYIYSVTWYFKLQKAIIDLFAGKKDLNFIFKFAPGQDWCAASTLKYIKKKSFSNIKVIYEPVADCVGKASKIILDFPSTSFYEAAAAGVPVMSLYNNPVRIKKEAVQLFGRSLQRFNDIDDAVDIIERFIEESPEDFVTDVPTVKGHTIEILTNLKKENEDRKKG
ncbi:MAG: hypothetical protein KAI70_05520, partial [Candidatus Omnitrophica bacterium]|nr:hypothetical protein [Candidatus Omnitrophota bacterium]